MPRIKPKVVPMAPKMDLESDWEPRRAEVRLHSCTMHHELQLTDDTTGEYVIPGNIIFRQRGTAWFPGENCKFGRDHCIFATESGYVRYYKDPRVHPDRQYIGVALEKEHSLPYPINGARRRRLNMVATTSPIVEPALVTTTGDGEDGEPVRDRVLTMGNRYAFREANWQIGRAAERAGVKVNEFVPGDRWAAWRKSKARIQANEEKKRLRSSSKKGGKAKKDAKRGR
jgi:large subunit ribosomal protein L27